LERKFSFDGTQYLIKWKDYNIQTWQSKEDLNNCKNLLEEFRKENPPAIIVKDMQKQLPLPKFCPQPQDYYRKVSCGRVVTTRPIFYKLLIFILEKIACL
jgi:hypothetical protein